MLPPGLKPSRSPAIILCTSDYSQVECHLSYATSLSETISLPGDDFLCLGIQSVETFSVLGDDFLCLGMEPV